MTDTNSRERLHCWPDLTTIMMEADLPQSYPISSSISGAQEETKDTAPVPQHYQ